MKKHLHTSSNRLLQYSAAALGALATQGVNAQVAFTDIDPDIDLHYFTGDTYMLDINNDGTDDFEISAVVSSTVFTGSSSSLFTSYTYKIKVTPLLDNDVLITGGGNLLSVGEMIDSDLPVGTFLGIPGYFFPGYSEIPEFVGLRFNDGGAEHYGWLRLTSDGSTVNLMDYAMELTEDIGIVAQVPGGPLYVSDIAIADISDTHTLTDVQVSFTIPDDESGTLSYRVFAGELIFNKLAAITADASQYTEVFPTGSNQVFTLNPSQLDVLMNEVNEFDKLVFGILCVSAANIYESAYSQYMVPLVPGHKVEPVTNVEVTHEISAYPAASINVNFTTPEDMHGIINYMSYVIPADMFPVLDSTSVYTNNHHIVLNDYDVPGGEFDPNHTYTINVSAFDVSGNELVFGEQYAACVQSHTEWPEYSDYAFETMKCSDTFTITDESIGISEILSNEMTVFTDAQGIHLQAVQQVKSLELLSVDGKIMFTDDHITDNTIIPLPDAAGIYFVRARFESGYGVKKVLVNK